MRLYLLAIATTLAFAPAAEARGGDLRLDPDLQTAANGIRNSHQRLLRAPGGISIEFHLDVEQDPKHTIFLWEQGLDGFVGVRWPELRCRVEGVMWGKLTVSRTGSATRVGRPTVRDACYDFEKQVGVLRDSKDLGQVTNYRPSFSAIDAFPLLYQFYSEMDQHYVPGRKFETEYCLPEAFEQHEYKFSGTEAVDGVQCEIIERAGLDRVWVAPSRGHAVLKREYNYGAFRPIRERVFNTQWKQVLPDLWIPMLQTRESFSDRPALPPVRFTLTVKRVRVGDLKDGDVRVVLTDDVRHIEDHITGMVHGTDGLAGDRLEESVRKSSKPASHGLVFIWLNVAIVLGVVLFWIRRLLS